MKKLIIAILMMVSGGAAMAQDFQFHYDFGRNLYGTEESSRARTTLTYEQFKAAQEAAKTPTAPGTTDGTPADEAPTGQILTPAEPTNGEVPF